MRSMLWLGRLIALALAAASALIVASPAGPHPASANHTAAADEMTITHSGVCGVGPVPACSGMDPGPGGGGTVLTAFIGEPFDVQISVTAQWRDYDGYQWELAWLDAVVDVAGGVTELDTTMELCAWPEAIVLGATEIYGNGSGCLSANGSEFFVNPVTNVDLQCVSEGATQVRLVSQTEDPNFFTQFIMGGAAITTILENQIPNPTPPPATVAAVEVQCYDGAPDVDGDGCSAREELGTDPRLGGDRDRFSPWDFFDVPTPALTPAAPGGMRDKAIGLSDVSAVLYYIGAVNDGPPNASGVDYDSDLNGNGAEDGTEYDRTPSADMNKRWRSGPPSGAVTLADASIAIGQAGHSCIAPP